MDRLSNRKKFCTPASARCGCSAFLQAAKTRRRRGELHCTVRDCFLLLTGAAERERSFFYKARSISTQSIFHAQINTANSCQKQCLKKKSHPDNCCCETQERLTGSQFKQSTDFTSFSTSASFKKTAPTLIELQQTLEMCSIWKRTSGALHHSSDFGTAKTLMQRHTTSKHLAAATKSDPASRGTSK